VQRSIRPARSAAIPSSPTKLVERVTPTAGAMVLCHLGVPRLDPDDWSLTVDGPAQPLSGARNAILGIPIEVM
jgi:hypothetical protein